MSKLVKHTSLNKLVNIFQVSACEAMVELLKEIGVGIDGGKDSLSMAARVEGKTVKCPGALVISAYVTVDDITAKVTPDLKDVDGETTLIHVDLSKGLICAKNQCVCQCLRVKNVSLIRTLPLSNTFQADVELEALR